jgi:hypothetical protein
LPTPLWPQPVHQRANRAAFTSLLESRPQLRAAALAAGFTTNALGPTEGLFDHWARALASTNVFWPTNDASQWVYRRIAARTEAGLLALGPVQARDPAGSKQLAEAWPPDLVREGVVLSGWELLGPTVFDTVIRELPQVLIPIFVLVCLSLWLAFRSVREVFLSLLTLGFSGLLLGALMALLGWEWNILNLMALPLLLGMGVDFSIHMQLALRRYHGDRMAVRRSVSRALLLAGSTTVVGFGSLAFSTNAGMASLGKVCALGISLALIVAVYLLPVWWLVGQKRSSKATERV